MPGHASRWTSTPCSQGIGIAPGAARGSGRPRPRRPARRHGDRRPATTRACVAAAVLDRVVTRLATPAFGDGAGRAGGDARVAITDGGWLFPAPAAADDAHLGPLPSRRRAPPAATDLRPGARRAQRGRDRPPTTRRRRSPTATSTCSSTPPCPRCRPAWSLAMARLTAPPVPPAPAVRDRGRPPELVPPAPTRGHASSWRPASRSSTTSRAPPSWTPTADPRTVRGRPRRIDR